MAVPVLTPTDHQGAPSPSAQGQGLNPHWTLTSEVLT